MGVQMGTRTFVRLVAVVSAVIASLVACSGDSGTKGVAMPEPSAAADAIVRTWLSEDKAVIDTCTYLRSTEPANLSTLADAAVAGTKIREAVRGEAEHSVTTLFSALDIDLAKCPVDKVLDKSTQIAACEGELDAKLDSLAKAGAGVNARKSELAKAVRAYGLTGASILRDPLSLAHTIDFSPAAMAALASVSDSLDATVEKAASSFGFAQGLVRTLLEYAAAEIVARGLDVLVTKLEVNAYVQPASLARSACALVDHGQGHARVTRRLLRRMILRFTDRWLATEKNDANQPTYAPTSTCRLLKEVNAKTEHDPCKELAAQLGENVAAGVDAVSPPKLVSTSVQAPPADCKDCKKDDVELLLNAAVACPSSKRACSLERVVYVASIMRVDGELGSASLKQLEDHLDKLERLFSESGDRVKSVDNSVHDLRGALQDVQDELASGAHRDLETRRQLLDILRASNSRCVDYFARRLGARRAVLQRYLRIESEVATSPGGSEPAITWAGIDCSKPTTGRERYRATFLDGARPPSLPAPVAGGTKAAIVSRSAICEVGFPIDIAVVKEKAFEGCDHRVTPEVRDLLKVVGKALLNDPDIEPTAMIVVGHSDERGLSDNCTAYADNHQLSVRRAESVRDVLEEVAPRWKGRVTPYGRGTSELLKRGCPLADDDCNALNRRMSLELYGGKLVSFDPSCPP